MQFWNRFGSPSNQIEAALVNEDAIAAAAGGLGDDAQLLKVCNSQSDGRHGFGGSGGDIPNFADGVGL